MQQFKFCATLHQKPKKFVLLTLLKVYILFLGSHIKKINDIHHKRCGYNLYMVFFSTYIYVTEI